MNVPLILLHSVYMYMVWGKCSWTGLISPSLGKLCTVIAILMKGLTHESTKFYTHQELFWANLLNSELATFFCYPFLLINPFLIVKKRSRVVNT